MDSSPTNHDALQPPADEGLSLDKLNQAFAEMLGGGFDPYDSPPEAEPAAASDDSPLAAELARLGVDMPTGAGASTVDADETCDITPRHILEAMLFVGNRENQPISSARVAGLMRGVRPAEIDDLVRELNAHYAACRCPYTIVSEGDGYRMKLRDDFSNVRDRFYGRVRQARLSAAAVEVLALVAYKEPITGEEIAKLIGANIKSLLTQLVRRELLSIERPEENPQQPIYRTTQRFLQLFNLERLEDLPRSQELSPQ